MMEAKLLGVEVKELVEKVRSDLMRETKEDVEKIVKLIHDERQKYEDALKGRISEADFKAFQEKSHAATLELMKKIDEIELRLKASALTQSVGKIASEQHKAFMDWLRTGRVSENLRQSAGSPEQKVMTLSEPTTGGYLASPEFSTELIRYITEFSPIRTIASIKQTSKTSYYQRKRTGIPTGGRAGETDTRSATTGLTFGQDIISTIEYYAMDDVSRWNLDDSDFNLEAELLEAFGEALGVLEGYDFVKGSGSNGVPEGILTNANVGAILTGNASDITADSLMALYFEPKSAYVPRAVWLMNRKTMLRCATLKDNYGAYLLQRLGDAPGWQILGAKVIEVPDMPDIAANAFPIAFGDFNRGYLIVDRTEVVTMRDPFTQAGSGAVRFWVFKRTGGKVVVPEAIKKLKVATS